MAADSVNKLNLNLVHGPDKHDVHIELPGTEAGDVLTVRHLAAKVEELTGVPSVSQKLIFKGKSLSNHSQPLSDLGLKNSSKIMLIGKRLSVEEDAVMSRLKGLESKVGGLDKKLSDVIYEVDGIHRGYLPQHLTAASLDKLQRRLLSVQEDLTRLLEELDTFQLQEGAGEVRAARKALVTRIQTLLERGDGVNLGLSEMLLQSKP